MMSLSSWLFVPVDQNEYYKIGGISLEPSYKYTLHFKFASKHDIPLHGLCDIRRNIKIQISQSKYQISTLIWYYRSDVNGEWIFDTSSNYSEKTVSLFAYALSSELQKILCRLNNLEYSRDEVSFELTKNIV